MENNSFYNNQNVYVEADYENIIVVDPNKMVEPDGKVVERLINHEELVIYANLEAKVIPRTKLALGSNYDDTIQNLRIGAIDGEINSKVNFMKPKGKNYFDTSWTEQLTGQGSLSGEGINQTKISWNERKINTGEGQSEIQFVQKRTTTNQQDTQLLGIDRISIKLNTSYVPVVSIEMTDIQGRMLFEQGENSPYSAFMQMPYPLFTLTIKGYFGKAIRYELMLKNFNARFDASDGNYRISTQFIARTYAILSDIQVESLFTLPRMYAKNSKIGNATVKDPAPELNVGDNNSRIRTLHTTEGRNKISEVYSIYKSKGLIEDDFPDISLNELLIKLNSFERYVMDAYGEEDMSPLIDIIKYNDLIKEFRNRIYGASFKDNWYDKYIDPTRKLVLKGKDNPKIYRFKLQLSRDAQKQGIAELKKLLKEYNDKLNDNTTFGSNGKCVIGGETIDTSITCDIKYSNIERIIDDVEQIDFKKTYRSNKGNPNPTDVQLGVYKSQILSEFETTGREVDTRTLEVRDNQLFKTGFLFGERLDPKEDLFVTTFLGKLAKLEEKFNEKKDKVEDLLSKELAKKIKSKENGLGFDPTIKNIMAVICASTDGFFRLMDKVHEDAWEERKNPIRLTSIINSENAFEGKDSVESVSENGQLNNESIVYPWPQYLELRKDKKGNEEYVNVYPGDSSVAAKTQAYDSKTWPEVKFVEEYIRGTLEKEDQGFEPNYENEGRNTNYIFSSAIEYPFNDNPYTNLSEMAFLYEMFERTQLSSTVNKFIKGSDYQKEIYSVISDIEFLNVNEAVKNSPELISKLKNYGFTYDNIQEVFYNGSKMGSWNTFIRDEYVTDYIKSYNENPNKLYGIISLYNGGKDIDNSTQSIDKLKDLINSSSSNEVSFLDGYPFTSIDWVKQNSSGGNSILSLNDANKTTQSFSVLNSKKVIASFDDQDEPNKNRFFSNYFWLNNVSESEITNEFEITTILGARNYFNTRQEKDYFLTESVLDYSDNYDNTKNNLTSIQTTSLLNTPYFVNALINGVDKEKNGDETGYTALGYLYLNSLPLSTVSEKIKTNLSGTTKDGDYIYSVLKKYSAIHKQSYLWFLKNGAIWHRYKKHHKEGIDILSDVWKDFDYENSYDPITGDFTKRYFIRNFEGESVGIIGKFQDDVLSGETTIEYTSVSTGFYPKVIDSIYYYFTESSIFTDYTTEEFDNAYFTKKLQIRKKNDNFIFKGTGYDLQNPLRTFSQDSWFSYFNVNGNTDFLEYEEDKVLLVPSVGYTEFNQPKFECFNELGKVTQEIRDNKQIHNGSVRCLWVAPNYGYFDNDYIKKPEPKEYIKLIKNDSDNKQPFNLNNGVYSNIEDLINLFGEKTLDIFEELFLNFCTKPIGSEEVKDNDLNRLNLYGIMKKLFIVDNPFSDGGTEDYLKKLALSQKNSFLGLHRGTLFKEELILKMGNPSGYDKRVFNSFSNNSVNNPFDKINFGEYVSNTVPGIGGATLLESKTQNPESWQSIYLNFGDSNFENIKYTTNGSYITDFFYLFNVEFNKTNIELLTPLIKIYVAKRLNNENYSTQDFYDDLNDFITSQEDFHRNIINTLFINLNRKLPDVVTNYEETIDTSMDGANIAKIDIWETFRLMNDKWVSGQDFKERTIFEDFLFLDRANRPVGDKVIVNIDKLRKLLKNRDDSLTVYQLVSEIMTKNGFTFMPTPVYTNFYGRHDRVKEGEPIPQDIPNDMFGTFMEVDTRESRPRMLGIYIGEVSKNLKMDKNPNSRRLDDAFDLVRASDCPLIENTTDKKDYSDSNKCVGFNVDFGTRKQGIFKSISLDMSQHKNVAPTFQVLADMGSMASQQKVAQQSQSLYNFYKSQSYNCSITSMGNAMIQPTMYFNLRHVPMFTGPYLIINVSHNISSRDFVTEFEGIRIPKHALDVPDELVMSVNRELLKSIQEKYNQKNVESSKAVEESESGVGDDNQKSAPESQCQNITNYPEKEFTTEIKSYIGKRKLLNVIEQLGFLENMGLYLYCLAHLHTLNENGEFEIINNNIYNIRTSGNNNFNVTQGNQGLITKQYCVSVGSSGYSSMASFNSFEDSMEFMYIRYGNALTSILEDLINAEYAGGSQTISKKVNALTKFWANTTGRVSGNDFIEINTNVSQKLITDSNFKNEYNNVKSKFENAINSIV